MKIETKFYTIEIRPGSDAVWNVFPDGSTSANWMPPDEDGSFAHTARLCGFKDPKTYLLAHEVGHALVYEMMYDRPSYVVRMAAANKKADLGAAYMEEREIYRVQRAAASAMPIIDDAWHSIIDRLRELDLCGDPNVANPVLLAA